MPRYIILGNFTDQGIRKVKDISKRDETARRMIEQAGGNAEIYYTMGDYDFVSIVEMPSEESMLQFLLQIGTLGNVRTKTLKAWSESEIAKVVSHLQ